MRMPFCKSACITELNGADVCRQSCSSADTFVLIACHDGPASILLRWDEDVTRLVEVQAVPTAKPVSVAAFTYEGPASTTHYALVSRNPAP